MNLSKVLGLGIFACFLPFILSRKQSLVRREYLRYVYVLFPFIDLYITPVQQGAFSVFDGVSLLTVVLNFNQLRFRSRPNGGYLVLFAVFLVVIFAGAYVSEFFLPALIPFLKALLLFYFGKCLLDEINDNPGFGMEIIRYLRIASLLSIAFLLCQAAIGLKFTFYAELNSNTNTGAESTFRYPSYFQDAQKYAQFLAMTAFLFFIDDKKDQQRPAYIKAGLFVLMVCGIILSGGRAGFLGLCAGLVVLFLTASSKYRLIGGAFMGVAALVIISLGNKLPLLNRSESVDESYEIRNNIWNKALAIFHEHEMTGIGIGNYRNYVSRYSQDQFWALPNGEVLYYDHPESGYLKFLTELGIPGFSLTMLFFVLPIVVFVRAYVMAGKGERCYPPFFLVAGVLSWMISFVTVYTLSDLRIAVTLLSLVCLLIKYKPTFRGVC